MNPETLKLLLRARDALLEQVTCTATVEDERRLMELVFDINGHIAAAQPEAVAP